MSSKEIPPFDKQNMFHKSMIKAYKSGIIPNASTFRPYFKWKTGKCSPKDITRETAHNMLNEASRLLNAYYQKYPNACADMDAYINNDPWQLYRGFGDDKYMVSYLEAIENELINIMPLLN